MRTNIEIPKELLAQIDFQNTVNGGITETITQAWASDEGYKMVVKTAGINPDNIHIDIADKRFMIYHNLDVMEKTEQLPYFLVNLPLSPDVDVERITAQYETDGRIFINAPFNDWGKGAHKHIDIDKV